MGTGSAFQEGEFPKFPKHVFDSHVDVNQKGKERERERERDRLPGAARNCQDKPGTTGLPLTTSSAPKDGVTASLTQESNLKAFKFQGAPFVTCLRSFQSYTKATGLPRTFMPLPVKAWAVLVPVYAWNIYSTGEVPQLRCHSLGV